MATTSVIPAYLYYQYHDDLDLRTIFDVYNADTQDVITLFDNLYLRSIFSNNNFGLDYIANNLYSTPRPTGASDELYQKILQWNQSLTEHTLLNITDLKQRIATFLNININTVSITFLQQLPQAQGGYNLAQYNVPFYNDPTLQPLNAVSNDRGITVSLTVVNPLWATLKDYITANIVEFPLIKYTLI